MREVKFRGKRIDNGEWVYGFYVYCTDGDKLSHRIYIFFAESYGKDVLHPIYFDVIPKTVGQYTGLKDKNGKDIYEGDIVKIIDYMSEEHISIVKYDDELLQFIFKTVDGYYSNMGVNKVIGNIYDNPELLNN